MCVRFTKSRWHRRDPGDDKLKADCRGLMDILQDRRGLGEGKRVIWAMNASCVIAKASAGELQPQTSKFMYSLQNLKAQKDHDTGFQVHYGAPRGCLLPKT